MLETEFETRSNQQQLATWNEVDFGYKAPTASQYLEGERQLAQFGTPRAKGAPEPILVANAPSADDSSSFPAMVSPITGQAIAADMPLKNPPKPIGQAGSCPRGWCARPSGSRSRRSRAAASERADLQHGDLDRPGRTGQHPPALAVHGAASACCGSSASVHPDRADRADADRLYRGGPAGPLAGIDGRGAAARRAARSPTATASRWRAPSRPMRCGSIPRALGDGGSPLVKSPAEGRRRTRPHLPRYGCRSG